MYFRTVLDKLYHRARIGDVKILQEWLKKFLNKYFNTSKGATEKFKMSNKIIRTSQNLNIYYDILYEVLIVF